MALFKNIYLKTWRLPEAKSYCCFVIMILIKALLFSIFLISLVDIGFAQVSVRGYYRSNSTYVQPHMRSSPDHNPYNNYSYPENTNPYTGKVATGNPETYLKNYKSNGNSNSGNDNSNSLTNLDYTPSNSSTYHTEPAASNQRRNFFGDIMTKEQIENENKTSLENQKANEKSLKEFENRNKTISHPKIAIKNNLGKKQGYLKLIEDNVGFKTYQLYDLSNNIVGKIEKWPSGNVFVYDNFGHLISRK